MGMFTFIQTNMNAQIGPFTPSGPVEIPLEIIPLEINITNLSDAVPVEDVIGKANISITIESNASKELAVAVYSPGAMGGVGSPQIIRTSQNPTQSYNRQLTFDAFENDAVRVECGHIDNNGNYIPDSGCIVVVQPR